MILSPHVDTTDLIHRMNLRSCKKGDKENNSPGFGGREEGVGVASFVPTVLVLVFYFVILGIMVGGTISVLRIEDWWSNRRFRADES